MASTLQGKPGTDCSAVMCQGAPAPVIWITPMPEAAALIGYPHHACGHHEAFAVEALFNDRARVGCGAAGVLWPGSGRGRPGGFPPRRRRHAGADLGAGMHSGMSGPENGDAAGGGVAEAGSWVLLRCRIIASISILHFLIDSLFDSLVLFGMELHLHTNQFCRYPKKK
jgi:hypothetical protein